MSKNAWGRCPHSRMHLDYIAKVLILFEVCKAFVISFPIYFGVLKSAPITHNKL